MSSSDYRLCPHQDDIDEIPPAMDQLECEKAIQYLDTRKNPLQQRHSEIQTPPKRDKQHHCRKAYNNYVEDHVSGGNPEKLWSFVKGKKCDSSDISPLRKDGAAHSNPQAKANIINNSLSALLQRKTDLVNLHLD